MDGFPFRLKAEDGPDLLDPQEIAITLREEIRALRSEARYLKDLFTRPGRTADEPARCFSLAQQHILQLDESADKVEHAAEQAAKAYRAAR